MMFNSTLAKLLTLPHSIFIAKLGIHSLDTQTAT